jgi:aspartokinase
VTIISASALAAAGARVPSSEEFLRALLELLSARRIVPLVTAASALNVTFAVESAALADGRQRDLLEEISRIGEARVEQGRAIVSLVGEEMKSDSALVGRVFSAVEQMRLGLILSGSSPIAMSFIVEDRDVEGVIARLHEVFFDQLDPRVFT